MFITTLAFVFAMHGSQGQVHESKTMGPLPASNNPILDQLKLTLGNQPQVFNEVMEILKTFPLKMWVPPVD